MYLFDSCFLLFLVCFFMGNHQFFCWFWYTGYQFAISERRHALRLQSRCLNLVYDSLSFKWYSSGMNKTLVLKSVGATDMESNTFKVLTSNFSLHKLSANYMYVITYNSCFIYNKLHQRNNNFRTIGLVCYNVAAVIVCLCTLRSR